MLQQTTWCDRTHVAESCDADGPDSCIVPAWWRRGFSGDVCYQQRLFLPTWLSPYAPLSGSVLLGAHLGCPRLVAAVALLIEPGRAEQEGVICASPHWKGSVTCSHTLGAGCPCTVPPVMAGSHRLHLADLSPTWKRPSQAMRLVPWLWKLPRTARVCSRGHILPPGPGRCWESVTRSASGFLNCFLPGLCCGEKVSGLDTCLQCAAPSPMAAWLGAAPV